ncbi:MAG: WD40/YVTN/BNR-like repeat-containing protein, partial [Lysobacterales bacterium]
MHRTRSTLILSCFGLLAAAFPAARAIDSVEPDAPQWRAYAAHQRLADESLLQGSRWRSIGPVVQGGRVVDVESIPGKPYGFYVAYASGGVWKTLNNGVSFTPLSDRLPTLISGDIAVDPQLPGRLWIGTGEPNSSRSSYGGMGVLVSDDEGQSFRHSGLSDVDRIARILVHPKDSNRVCVAAIGRLYSDGGRRGVFCTRDGGTSWKQVLATTGMTGAIDLAMDPGNPELLYAATWERSRSAWNFVESGEGSGIYKSSDGGDTWARLAGGFPTGREVGRIGLAIAASDPKVLYASVDNWSELPDAEQDLGDQPLSPRRLKKMSKAEFLAQPEDAIEAFIRDNDLDTDLDAKTLIAKVESDQVSVADLVRALNDAEAALFNTDIRGLEIYRSNDAGQTWSRTHDQPLREVTYTYGYYFGQIRVAPDNPEQIYVLGVPLVASSDGGKTF